MGKHLLDQIKSKILSIAKIFYSGYELLFMFNNITNYAIYAKDALQVAYYINKDLEGQQSFL